MSDHIPPDVRNFRWPVLVLCCLMVAGKYYSFDLPAAVYDKLENRFHHFHGSFVLDFNLMYTFYCFPNIFLPLFGGHLVDRFGQRSMIIIFTSCSFIGQFIVSFGVNSLNFNLILFGRFIFGVGESLNITIITILSSYFVQGELAFAFIILFLSTRFCTFLNLLMSPIIVLEHGVAAAFWIGTLICSVGVVAALVLAEVDDALKSPYTHAEEHSYSLDIGKGTHASHDKNGTNIFGSFTSSLKTRSSIPSPLPVVMEDEDDIYDEEQGNSADRIIAQLHSKQEGYGTFSPKKSHNITVEPNESSDEHTVVSNPPQTGCCHKSILCIYFLCFFLYGAILPFYDMANPIIHIGFFQGHDMKHMDDHEKELWISRLQSIPILILAVFAPCIGVAVDYYGHRPSFFVVAATLLAFSHCMIASRLGDLNCLVASLVLIGLAHALTVAVTWTCIQYLVSPAQQGFTNGVLLSIYHLAQSMIPVVVSYMITTRINFIDSHVSKHKYVALELIDIRNCEAFLVAMSIMALFFSLLLFIFDESGHAELRLSGIAGRSYEYELLEDFDDRFDDDSESICIKNDNALDNIEGDSGGYVKLNSRQRSKSMSDTAPLTSCMRKYYLKRRMKGKCPKPLAGASCNSGSIEKAIDSIDDPEHNGNNNDDSSGEDKDDDFEEVSSRMRRRTVSFAGDCDFTPQRRAGQGQHPPIVPLSIKIPKPAPSKKMFFAHF